MGVIAKIETDEGSPVNAFVIVHRMTQTTGEYRVITNNARNDDPVVIARGVVEWTDNNLTLLRDVCNLADL